MTAPGRYSASDGSFAKSAGSAAARGGVLIGIAVLIGLLLLWRGFDGGDDDAAGGETPTTQPAGDGSDETPTSVPGDDGDGGEVTDTTATSDGTDVTVPGDSAPATVVDDPADVTVAVLNGTGQPGLAGDRSSTLSAAGYKITAGNAASADTEASKVYYAEGFADEAKAVAEALSGSASVLEPAPPDVGALANEGGAADATAADIVVVLGTDNALS